MVDALKPPARASSGEARALLLLDQLPGVGPRTIRGLVEAFGSAEGALAARRSMFAQVAGRQAAQARGSTEHARRVDDGLSLGERLGMRVTTWSDPGYPRDLLRLADPPPVLFLRGRGALVPGRGVAVVGSRRCTARGKDLSRRIGQALSMDGNQVVSGMALGVDAAAHEGALEGEGSTVAVVGRGADAPYPPSHRRLFGEILERGVVVSEFLPGTPPMPHHFPRRNRIMAALARCVVVVEAGRRSGALITVEHALDLGRDVWAVPGPIDTRACDGSNRLLSEGALPLVSIRRFVGELGGEAGGKTESHPQPAASGGETPSGAGLAEPERRLLRSLEGGPLHVDQLAARAGVEVPTAMALLVRLELRGVVEQMPGLRFRAA